MGLKVSVYSCLAIRIMAEMNEELSTYHKTYRQLEVAVNSKQCSFIKIHTFKSRHDDSMETSGSLVTQQHWHVSCFYCSPDLLKITWHFFFFADQWKARLETTTISCDGQNQPMARGLLRRVGQSEQRRSIWTVRSALANIREGNKGGVNISPLSDEKNWNNWLFLIGIFLSII